MRAEVRQGPGELGRRIAHTLREVLVRTSAPSCHSHLVPMPARPVRIKAENFFPLDINAKGGAPILLSGTARASNTSGGHLNETRAEVGLGRHTTRHRSSSPSPFSSVIGRTRIVEPYTTTNLRGGVRGFIQGFRHVCRHAYRGKLSMTAGTSGVLPRQTFSVLGHEVTIHRHDGDALCASLGEVRRDRAPCAGLCG